MLTVKNYYHLSNMLMVYMTDSCVDDTRKADALAEMSEDIYATHDEDIIMAWNDTGIRYTHSKEDRLPSCLAIVTLLTDEELKGLVDLWRTLLIGI